MFLFFFAMIFSSSFLLTAIYRRFALNKLLIDIPNERSSHSVPTPRGGGIAVVITWCIGVIASYFYFDWSPTQLAGWIIPGCLLAVISFIDDMGHVSPSWRLLVQAAAASIGVYLLGDMPKSVTNPLSSIMQIGVVIFVILSLVWLTNLYNFMDGINGIASLEAMAVCFGLFIQLWLFAPGIEPNVLPLILGAAVSGFCVWNFPKAKIFMGDIGSCFIGLQLGLFAVYYAGVDLHFFVGVVILLAAFVSDASVTLLRRIFRGQKIYLAHREHAYQHLARLTGSHTWVSLAYALITILWLLPLSSLVIMGKLPVASGLSIAYLPLMLCALACRAGASEAPR